MKLSTKQIIDTKHLPFLPYIYAGIVVNVVIIITVLLIQNLLPPEIPLFYGLAEGQEQITNSIFLFIPNGVSLAILLVNLIVASASKQEYYKKILVVAGLIVTFFATITVLKIIFLVGSI